MATLQELRKYLGYQFSTGSYTGEDYKRFQTKYINYLKTVAKQNGWELANVGRSHYCFSAFFKEGEKYVYISIPDVRYWDNEWYLNILIRNAKHAKDYRGCRNYRTDLEDLAAEVRRLFGIWETETTKGGW